jgi:3-hydroxy-3-methylglutaryl CoA synthase
MNRIVDKASYIPYCRLERKAIGETLGASAGSGSRSVACYDEDTMSMAVGAARAAGQVRAMA